MTDRNSEKMYRPKELQARWRCGDNKVREFIQTGALKAINLATASSKLPRYLVPEWAVLEFEASRMTAADQRTSERAPRRSTARPPSRY